MSLYCLQDVIFTLTKDENTSGLLARLHLPARCTALWNLEVKLLGGPSAVRGSSNSDSDHDRPRPIWHERRRSSWAVVLHLQAERPIEAEAGCSARASFCFSAEVVVVMSSQRSLMAITGANPRTSLLTLSLIPCMQRAAMRCDAMGWDAHTDTHTHMRRHSIGTPRPARRLPSSPGNPPPPLHCTHTHPIQSFLPYIRQRTHLIT